MEQAYEQGLADMRKIHAEYDRERKEIELKDALTSDALSYWSSLGRGPMAHKIIMESSNAKPLEDIREQIAELFPKARCEMHTRINPCRLVLEDPPMALAELVEPIAKEKSGKTR